MPVDIFYSYVSKPVDYYEVPSYQYVIKDDSYVLPDFHAVIDPDVYVMKTTTEKKKVYHVDLEVYYPFNKYKLTDEALDKLRDFFSSYSDFKNFSNFTVYGLASPEGKYVYNLMLSAKRAKSLYDYLVSKGLSGSYEGRGECKGVSVKNYPLCRKAYTSFDIVESSVKVDSRIVYSYDGVKFFDENGRVVIPNDSLTDSLTEQLNDAVRKYFEDIKKGLLR
jgi:hypothetical protein